MDRAAITAGMPVRSSDGIFVGKVLGGSADGLIVERGTLMPKDYCIALSDVREVKGSTVELAIAACDVRGCWLGDAPPLEVGPEPPSVDLALGAEGSSGTSESLRVPLAEEELIPEKRLHEIGRVRIRKEVRTEHRTITVPVRREVVTVERLAPGEPPSARDEEGFETTILVVPIVEEQVEVRKRPVVREEVHVRKSIVEERRIVSADVRREEAHIDEDGSESARSPSDGPADA
jgi:uncharacterized protein (TIGR02271 family)